MVLSDFIRLGIFLVVTVTISVWAGSIVVRGLIRRFIQKAPAPVLTAGKKWTQRVVLSLAGVGVLCGAYGYFVEPYWLEVTHVPLTSGKLPKGAKPVRIVQISDTHCEAKPRLEEKLPDVIAQLKPDLIVFTGDATNEYAGRATFQQCLTRLAAIAPTFIVQGNWDVGRFGEVEVPGAKVLDGDVATINVRGVDICIAGVGCGSEWRIPDTLAKVDPGRLTVFLYHTPDEVNAICVPKVDLYCAGHTHGGQVALPWYGALTAISKFGKQYEAGLYRVGPTWLYVNRGIGLEGSHAPRVRFCARPEVTVFEVSPQE